VLHHFGAGLDSALRWPALQLQIRVSGADGHSQQARLRADTLEVDLLQQQYSIIWRALLPCTMQGAKAAGVVSIWHA